MTIKNMLNLSGLIILFILSISNSNAMTIGFSPVTSNGVVGTYVDVELFVTDLGLGTSPSLGEFDLDVMFDPAVIGFNSVSYGDPILFDQLDIFGLGSITDTTIGADFVNLFELSLDSASDLNDFQADSFTLATLTFDLLAEGSSSLFLSLWSLADAEGNALSANLLSGSVNVAPVPEPTTLLLLMTGLAGVSFFRRKRKA